ncbi:MAG: pitrilysin family protein [Gammaproteobacteria bacterium]|nr:pitrilysin family protein [Gammaproteobacteria bacterium]
MKQAVVGILLAVASAGAHAALDIQHWTTANGARVYFVETHQIPMVQYAVGFDAAGARDPEDRHGLASLVNTLMDDGAGGMDEETVAEKLAAVGARYSSQSARDMSTLELKVLSEGSYLEPAVDVFAQIIARPDFPADALERERRRTLVGIEQARQSARDVAQRVFYAELFAGHPYGHMPEGDEQSVKKITRADLISFHERYYTGANAVVAIVGDLSRARAEETAEKIVGLLPEGDPAPPLAPVAGREKSARVEEPFPSQQSHLLLGQPGITRDDPDYFPLYVGNHILGGSGLISRLSVQIREERGLAYSVYSYFVPMQRRGPYMLGLQTKNEQADNARKIVIETVGRFIDEGPAADELEAARNNITGGFPLRLDSNEEIAGNLLNIAYYGLPLDYLDTYPEKVSAVTIEEIRDAFRRRIDPQQWVQVRVGPADE